MMITSATRGGNFLGSIMRPLSLVEWNTRVWYEVRETISWRNGNTVDDDGMAIFDLEDMPPLPGNGILGRIERGATLLSTREARERRNRVQYPAEEIRNGEAAELAGVRNFIRDTNNGDVLPEAARNAFRRALAAGRASINDADVGTAILTRSDIDPRTPIPEEPAESYPRLWTATMCARDDKRVAILAINRRIKQLRRKLRRARRTRRRQRRKREKATRNAQNSEDESSSTDTTSTSATSGESESDGDNSGDDEDRGGKGPRMGGSKHEDNNRHREEGAAHPSKQPKPNPHNTWAEQVRSRKAMDNTPLWKRDRLISRGMLVMRIDRKELHRGWKSTKLEPETASRKVGTTPHKNTCKTKRSPILPPSADDPPKPRTTTAKMATSMDTTPAGSTTTVVDASSLPPTILALTSPPTAPQPAVNAPASAPTTTSSPQTTTTTSTWTRPAIEDYEQGKAPIQIYALNDHNVGSGPSDDVGIKDQRLGAGPKGAGAAWGEAEEATDELLWEYLLERKRREGKATEGEEKIEMLREVKAKVDPVGETVRWGERVNAFVRSQTYAMMTEPERGQWLANITVDSAVAQAKKLQEVDDRVLRLERDSKNLQLIARGRCLFDGLKRGDNAGARAVGIISKKWGLDIPKKQAFDELKDFAMTGDSVRLIFNRRGPGSVINTIVMRTYNPGKESFKTHSDGTKHPFQTGRKDLEITVMDVYSHYDTTIERILLYIKRREQEIGIPTANLRVKRVCRGHDGLIRMTPGDPSFGKQTIQTMREALDLLNDQEVTELIGEKAERKAREQAGKDARGYRQLRNIRSIHHVATGEDLSTFDPSRYFDTLPWNIRNAAGQEEARILQRQANSQGGSQSNQQSGSFGQQFHQGNRGRGRNSANYRGRSGYRGRAHYSKTNTTPLGGNSSTNSSNNTPGSNTGPSSNRGRSPGRGKNTSYRGRSRSRSRGGKGNGGNHSRSNSKGPQQRNNRSDNSHNQPQDLYANQSYPG